MMKVLAPYEARLFAVLRIVAGFLFSLHGLQKHFGWPPGGRAPAPGSQLWFGGWLEIVCGLLIAFGFLTRPAAFVASGVMAVAYFQFHWKLTMGGSQWVPLVNRGELAVLYCFLFLYVAARGPGIWSLDRRSGRD